MELRKKVCCLEMFNILEDGLLDERVSGIFLQKSNSECVGNVSSINFCPMCGKEFESIKCNNSWDWKIKD